MLRHRQMPDTGRRRQRALLQRPRRGIILVLALWMIIVLSLVAYSLSYEMQIEMRLTSHRRDSVRALELAKLGVARAVVDLKNDAVMDHGVDIRNLGVIAPYDGLKDEWNNPDEYLEMEAGDGGLYSVHVVDEESKISLNGINPQHVNLLKNLMRVLEVNDNEAEEVAEAIYDWMDPDDQPIGGEGESEVLFYNEAFARSQGERWDEDEDEALVLPQNEAFITLEQLLLVPGMTKEIFYGYDPEDPDQVEDRQERLNSDREVTPGLRDYLTVTSTGMLNVNTASLEALTALFATASGDNIKDGEKAADELQDLIGAGRKGRSSDKSLRSRQELMQAFAARQEMIARANMIQMMDVRSSTFTITAEGKLLDAGKRPRVSRQIETVVFRSYQTFTVNDNREDNRERRYNRERFLQRARRSRSDATETIGSIQIPVVVCFWWNES